MFEIAVSVCCLVYNHEKYLAKCLDGIINQKTKFKFEVLIHDDASTDNSRKIIESYAKKYPEIIKPIYQTQNQYSKNVNINFVYQYPRVKGKYIALCEGDDFWIDEYKLQKQYDCMEKNVHCSLCTHIVKGVDIFENTISKTFPINSFSNNILKADEIIKHICTIESYPFQTSSFFYRSKYIKELILNEIPTFMKLVKSGDMTHLLYLISKGDIFYIDEVMSCYRIGTEESWSMRMKHNHSLRTQHQNNYILALQEYDKYTNYKYTDIIQLDIKQRRFSIFKEEFNLKMMKSNQYRKMYDNLSLIEKIFYSIGYYIPVTRRFIINIKQNIK